MKRPYQVTAIVCILFSAFIGRQSLAMKYYSETGPGPGFFPFWLSVIFAVLSVAMLLEATCGRSDPMPEDFFASGAGYMRMAAILLAFAAAIVLMAPLGYRLTALAFVDFLLLALGRQSLVVTGLISLAGSFGVYQVFVEWLKVPLPTGMFGI